MKKFILFDFDGVIADSFDTAFEIQRKICPSITVDNYRKRFEGNINDWDKGQDTHGPDCRHDINFFDEYAPRMKTAVKIIPRIKEVIVELEKNYSLIVISSTITSPIEEFIKRYGLASHFLQIMGNDVHKSKVEKIKMVFQKYNITSKDCVFITDTLGDMREASKVGVGSIGVTWGFHSPQVLKQGQAFKLVKQPGDIIDTVEQYFA